tara:strand:+ start:663 stop:1229 length:567 start_codon:yes stop_codon:yes gene_type:complete
MSFFKENNIVMQEGALRTRGFKDIYEMDNFIQAKYNILDNYLASDLYVLPLEKCSNSLSLRQISFINHKDTVCLVFPNYGVRIGCTKNFVKKIPFLKTLIDGPFNKDDFKVYEYYNDQIGSIEVGSCLIILQSTEMESILLGSSISVQTKKWQNKGYYVIEDIICENLFDVILLTNRINDDENNFNYN